jgi:hypothetical protein
MKPLGKPLTLRHHKSVNLKYLRQMNRLATRLLHDAVFENPVKKRPLELN